MTGAELLFWAEVQKDFDPDRNWLCLRPSYFDLLRANGYPMMGAIKQLMADAQKVNGPV